MTIAVPNSQQYTANGISVRVLKYRVRKCTVTTAVAEAGSHAHAVATDARDQRAALSHADSPGLPELQRVETAAAFGLDALAQSQLTHLGAATQPLAGEQDEAVDDEEDRRIQRLRE